MSIGKALVRVFKVAEERGLTDDMVTQAEGLVGEAQRQFNDNAYFEHGSTTTLTSSPIDLTLPTPQQATTTTSWLVGAEFLGTARASSLAITTPASAWLAAGPSRRWRRCQPRRRVCHHDEEVLGNETEGAEMTGRAAILIALLLQAASAQHVNAQADAGFAGEWHSVAAKPGMASVRIVKGATGWTAQAFAPCQPTPCDWGTVPFTILEHRPKGSGGAVGLATWRRGSATRIMTFRLGEGSLLVEIYNLFSGPRDQPSYFVTEELALPARLPAVRTPPGAKR